MDQEIEQEKIKKYLEEHFFHGAIPKKQEEIHVTSEKFNASYFVADIMLALGYDPHSMRDITSFAKKVDLEPQDIYNVLVKNQFIGTEKFQKISQLLGGYDGLLTLIAATGYTDLFDNHNSSEELEKIRGTVFVKPDQVINDLAEKKEEKMENHDEIKQPIRQDNVPTQPMKKAIVKDNVPSQPTGQPIVSTQPQAVEKQNTTEKSTQTKQKNTTSKYFVEKVKEPTIDGRTPAIWSTCLSLAKNLFSPDALNKPYLSQMTLARTIGYTRNGYIASVLKQLKIYTKDGKYVADSTIEQRAWILCNILTGARIIAFQRLVKKLTKKENKQKEAERIKSRRPKKTEKIEELEEKNRNLQEQNEKLQRVLEEKGMTFE